MVRSILFVALLLAPLGHGQRQAASVEAQTTGACSPNILHNQGKVQFICNAPLDKATASKIAALLNQLVKHQNDTALTNQKLDEILEFLKTHTQNPYDPVVLYSFDGEVKRISSNAGSRQELIQGGPAADAFKAMLDLQHRADWKGLLNLCSKEIADERGWATPYLFSSIAHINLGNLGLAADELKAAKQIVGDSAEYAGPLENVSRALDQARHH